MTSKGKAKTRNVTSEKEDYFKIYVKIEPTEEKYPLREVYNEMKIYKLKSYLEFATGIPVNLQRISYLDEGDLLDDTDVKSNDIVPGGTLMLQVWSQWWELIQAVAFNQLEKVFELGVTENSNYKTPNSEYMSLRARKVMIQERVNVALLLAAHRGHKHLVTKLIDIGADVNATTQLGRTALHMAAAQGKGNIIDLLLENGADIDKEDCEGRNALAIAERFGHKNCGRHLFLFRWQGRAVKLRPSKPIPLMAHQLTDSQFPVWKRGKSAQVYLTQVLPQREFVGTVIDAPKHKLSRTANKRDKHRRIKAEQERIKSMIQIYDVDATEGEAYVDESYKEFERRNNVRPPTHKEWLSKITESDEKIANAAKQRSQLRKQAEEDKLIEEMDKASTYEAWLQQKEVDKRRSTSPRDHLPFLPTKHVCLQLPKIERGVGALRLYLRSLGNDRSGQPYEEWLNKKEMEALK